MFSSLKDFIEKHEVLTLFSHLYPDGDAYGSLVGFKELIKTNYPSKQVYALGTPLASFSPLLGELDVVSDDIIKQSGALIIDVANGARVEDKRFVLALDSFKVDHHIFAEDFTTGSLVNTKRIATAEIIGEFMLEYDFSISSRGASALLLGIITDSGRFMYDLTSSVTFKVASTLLDKGADFKTINQLLSIRKIDSLKGKGYFLANYELFQNVIYIVVDKQTLASFNILHSQGGMFVNSYSNIEGYPLWATFFEHENGQYYVELRSSCKNVQKVASSFGGGGHYKASGCILKNKEVISGFLEALSKAEDL